LDCFKNSREELIEDNSESISDFLFRSSVRSVSSVSPISPTAVSSIPFSTLAFSFSSFAISFRIGSILIFISEERPLCFSSFFIISSLDFSRTDFSFSSDVLSLISSSFSLLIVALSESSCAFLTLSLPKDPSSSSISAFTDFFLDSYSDSFFSKSFNDKLSSSILNETANFFLV